MHAGSDPRAAAAGPPRPYGDPVWLITFADLVGLMLASFVMLFAMSGIDGAKWRGVADGLSRSLDPVIAIEDEGPRADRHVDAGAGGPGRARWPSPTRCGISATTARSWRAVTGTRASTKFRRGWPQRAARPWRAASMS